jgi:hypothetical protein
MNDRVRAALVDVRFADAAFHPLTYPLQRGKTPDQLPTYFQNGVTYQVVPGDESLNIWYSGLTSISRDTGSMGNKVLITRTSTLRLMILASMLRVSMNQDSIEQLIAELLPEKLTPETLQQLHLRSCSISVEGNSFDTAALYRREFAAKKSELKPEHALIEIRLKIETTYLKGCLADQCGCGQTY